MINDSADTCRLYQKYFSPFTGCLFSHCCVAPLHVAGCVHVDVDGGCCSVPCVGGSVCQAQYHTVHYWFHCSKLWSIYMYL